MDDRAGEEVALGADAARLPVVTELGVVESEGHEPLERDGAAGHLFDDRMDQARVAEGGLAGVKIERHRCSFSPAVACCPPFTFDGGW